MKNGNHAKPDLEDEVRSLKEHVLAIEATLEGVMRLQVLALEKHGYGKDALVEEFNKVRMGLLDDLVRMDKKRKPKP
jgi:hypothetical protein